MSGSAKCLSGGHFSELLPSGYEGETGPTLHLPLREATRSRCLNSRTSNAHTHTRVWANSNRVRTKTSNLNLRTFHTDRRLWSQNQTLAKKRFNELLFTHTRGWNIRAGQKYSDRPRFKLNYTLRPMKSLVSADGTSRPKQRKISSIWYHSLQFLDLNSTTSTWTVISSDYQEAGLGGGQHLHGHLKISPEPAVMQPWNSRKSRQERGWVHFSLQCILTPFPPPGKQATHR